VIPLSGRVPGRASGPSRSCVDDGGGLQYVSWKLIGAFRFSRRGEYIDGRTASGGGPGGHTTWWRWQGLGRATLWCAWPLVLLRLVSEKIGTLAFVSFNSEIISCVAFLKHKNSRKQGTDTMASH
jgi:hypothetical protein